MISVKVLRRFSSHQFPRCLYLFSPLSFLFFLSSSSFPHPNFSVRLFDVCFLSFFPTYILQQPERVARHTKTHQIRHTTYCCSSLSSITSSAIAGVSLNTTWMRVSCYLPARTTSQNTVLTEMNKKWMSWSKMMHHHQQAEQQMWKRCRGSKERTNCRNNIAWTAQSEASGPSASINICSRTGTACSACVVTVRLGTMTNDNHTQSSPQLLRLTGW